MTALDRDLRACVEFLAADPRRIVKAFRTHRRGSHGLCAQEAATVWPCTTHRLAVFAEQLYRDRQAARNLAALEGHRDAA